MKFSLAPIKNKITNFAEIVQKNLYFYIAGFILLYLLKYHYSIATAQQLNWILFPTSWLVTLLTGVNFKNDPDFGIVNHEHKLIIAASCAGVNFLIICFACFMYGLIHNYKNLKEKLFWFVFCAVSAFLFTIFTNTIRIIMSIYFFDNKGLYENWITPELFHQFEGIFIYFFFLVISYQIMNYLTMYLRDKNLKLNLNIFKDNNLSFKIIIPFLFYILVTLVAPVINHGIGHIDFFFIIHAIGVFFICSLMIIFFIVMQYSVKGYVKISRYFKGQQQR